MKKRDVKNIQYDVQLAANIIQARLDAGLTQEGLAKKMKTAQSAIARAEDGNVPPGHALLKRIAQALNLYLEPPRLKKETEEKHDILRTVKLSKVRDYLIKQTYKDDPDFKELKGYVQTKNGDTVVIISLYE